MELFEIEMFICIKMDLVLNNLQWLICRKQNQTDLLGSQVNILCNTNNYQTSFLYLFLMEYELLWVV